MVMNNPPPGAVPPEPPRNSRSGFTMVEVIIAIVILAFGLLGMAGTTALVVRQISLAEVATERSAALQTTLERLQALPFDSVSTGSDSVGIFAVDWNVSTFINQWKTVEVVTTGPGMASGSGGFPMLTAAVPDTFNYRIIRP
ncbi:MAG: prepilin-type N-terminal cleavage/methylation domain-containing protein [Longimicrobiales bacterium]